MAIFYYVFRHRIHDALLGYDRDMTVDDLERAVHRQKFSSYLPWRAYNEEKMYYYNSDETIGFIWECTPLCYAGDKTISTLEGLFRLGIPNGSVIQFILYADPYIDEILELYEKSKTRPSSVIKEQIRSFVEMFKKGTEKMKVFQGMPIRNYRLFVAIKIPEKLTENINLTDMYSNVKEILAGAGLHPENLKPEGLVDWMRRFFNDEPSLNNKVYNKEEYINKQVIFSDTVIKKNMTELKIGKRYFRCTTVKNFPQEVDALQTNQCFGGISGAVSDANQMLTPYLYSMNIVIEDLKIKLHTKCNLVLQQQAAGSLAPSLARKKEEYMRATDEIEKGTPFVRIIPTLWVWSEDRTRAAESLVRAKRLWEQNGYVMQDDQGIIPILFVSSLPCGLYNVKENIENIDRDFIAPVQAICPLLPVQADFTGGGYPQLLYVGRKGQPVRLDLFGSNAINYNVYIAASSGSGKSFLVNNIVDNYYGSGAKIRIIDIGGSYKTQANVHKGRYLEFSGDTRLCMNPFTNVSDDEDKRDIDLAAIVAILHTMVYSATATVPFANAETEMTILKSAARWAIKNYGAEADIDTVHAYLSVYPKYEVEAEVGDKEIFKEHAKRLAHNIADFTSSGAYGKWFNGKSNFDISHDDYVVLELEHLKAIDELFKVITLQVINAVTQDLYLSDRDRRRMVIFDEGWQFMKEGGGALKDIIEQGYRRSRKYKGSFTLISQSILDIKDFGSVGQVIMSNSNFQFYLQSNDYGKAREEKLLDIDDFRLEAMKSVSTMPGKYSEAYLIAGGYGEGVIRSVVPRMTYFLYTSNPTEKAEIEKIVKTEGKDYAEACREMAIRYPGPNY